MRGEGPGHGFAGAGTRRTNRQGQGGNATVTTGANRHGTGPSTSPARRICAAGHRSRLHRCLYAAQRWHGFPGSVILPPHGHRSTTLLATAFDPLAAARDLKAAGFEPEQAEALAAQLRFAAGADHADLATKADVATLHDHFEALSAATKADVEALRTATKADFETLRAETKADIEALRADLYRALWIQGGAIVAILTALRFLPV